MTSSPSTLPSLSLPGWFVVTLAALLTGTFCVFMWPDWLNNPDLSHGLFAPALFPLLLRESRRQGPWRHPADSSRLIAGRFLLLAASFAMVGLAGFYAAAVEWTHPLVSLCLALALSGILFSALLWLSSASVRALPLNWASFVAVAFWPLCAPLPPGTYSLITLQLQLWVTHMVLESLHMLGIAASTSGNIILLAHTSVGVEEACSGVRSLLSCVVAAIFFSATMVRRPWARVVLILVSPPLAFGMNIIRSLVLTLMANGGIDISGSWHDITGFAVLGVTALLLGGMAILLEDKHPTPEPAPRPPIVHRPRPWGLLGGFVAASVLIVFFVVKTRGPDLPAGPVPDVAALLPARPSGWDVVHTQDLAPFAPILETNHLVERSYVRRASATHPQPLLINVYVAYWSPGQVRVSSVAAHTPDACWPGSGWSSRPLIAPPSPFLVAARRVPAPEYRTFINSGDLRHVWYWHLYDGTSIAQGDPRSAVALLKIAWHYGFRTAGEQMFVRVSSNRPWDEIQDEPLVAEIFAGLASHGL